jgi:hypothetical protein
VGRVWNDADPVAAPIGWCIGTAKRYEDLDAQDASDAKSRYDTLEHKIVPRFYDRDAKDLPRAWLASIRQSMASLPRHGACTAWCTTTSNRSICQGRAGRVGSRRMVARAPAILRRLSSDYAPRGPPFVSPSRMSPSLQAGAMRAEIVADLGSLKPSDVTVQLWVAPSLGEAHPLVADFEKRRGGIARYGVQVPQETGADTDLVARVLPRHPALADVCVPTLITWSD